MNVENPIIIMRRKQALALGFKTHFTGKPCPQGHIAPRFSKGSNCTVCAHESKKEWAKSNPQKVRDYTKIWVPNPEIKRRSNRQWDKNNPEKKRKSCHAWSAKNPDKVKAMRKRAYDKRTPTARLATRIRARISDALKNGYKAARTAELISCTFDQLKIHLERQFTKKMSWENYGSFWHVDHIRPCTSYDLNQLSEQKACFHFTNLRPLEALENISKGNKITLLL